MSSQAERKIFDMIEAGQITAEEGLRLINAMGSSQNDTPIRMFTLMKRLLLQQSHLKIS